MVHNVSKFILEYQRANNIPDWQMANVLCIDETEWDKFAHSYGFALSTFQKIMFIEAFETTLPI